MSLINKLMSEINNNKEFEINTNSKHIYDKCHQEIKEEKWNKERIKRKNWKRINWTKRKQIWKTKYKIKSFK